MQKLFEEVENEITHLFLKLNKISSFNHEKVLNAFRELNISESCFYGSTGYGYGDLSREKLDSLYAKVFKGEDAVVRTQFVSGTHAIVKSIMGIVRPGEEIISATGTPYDTLSNALGIYERNAGLLKDFNILYKEIPLTSEGLPDLENLKCALSSRTKLVLIQRSRGYQNRPSLSIKKIESIVKTVKDFNQNIVCLVDNCYGEFVENKEPTEVGADLVVGSLIKNPGGSLAPTGGYVVGKQELIEKVASSLTAPGLGSSIGASLTDPRLLFQGFFMAPLVVTEALKGAIYTACLYEKLGFEVSPRYDEYRTDIVQAIKFNDQELLENFCHYLQRFSPVDSMAVPEASWLPGYRDKIIMAGGTFIQGSSIELSADAPVKPPYWLYLQGGISYEYTKIIINKTTEKLFEKIKK
ncbi:MAG: aluminum resistance family protein [Clostridia bacterium 41_269]|nr:MAG: aluminum resistance family protein [Clostridia bacterium 41_269]